MPRCHVVVCMFLCAVPSSLADEPAPKVSFLREVLPILRDNCFACHDSKTRKGKYDMTTFAMLLKGGSRGEAVVAGKPEESFLWTLTSGEEEPKMPPKEVKSTVMPEQIALIERWIKQGAAYDGADPQGNLLAELRKQWHPPTPPAKYTRAVPVRTLAFSPEGKHLLSNGYYEILIWDVATGRLAARLRTRAERANAMLFLDGQTLAVAGGRPGQEGDLRLYRIDWDRLRAADTVLLLDGTQPSKASCVKELLQTEDEILALALSTDGQHMAAAGCDRTIRVWDVKQDFKQLHTIQNHADWVVSLAFAPNGERLFSASRDKTAKVWDFAKKATVATFSSHQTTVNDVIPVQEGRNGVSVGEDSQVRMWRIEGNPQQMQLRALPGHTKAINKIALHPTQPRFATAGADGTIRLWNLPNGTPQRPLSGPAEWVFSLTFSPDGSMLASGTWNGEIRLWEANKGTLIRTILAKPDDKIAGEGQP